MNPAAKNPSSQADQPWTLSRLAAYEHRLYADESLDDDTLEERDRPLAKTLDPASSPSRIIQSWLDHPSPSSNGSNLGPTLHSAARLGTQLLYLAYALLGLGLGFQLLKYNGSEPVNVSAFFGLVILLQLLFVIVTVLLALIGIPQPKALELSPGVRITRTLTELVTGLVARLSSFSLDAQKRSELNAFLGRAKGRLWLYQNPIRWQSCAIASKSGIAFNLGICLAILAAVTFSDRAFGWQTALDVSAESIHSIVSLLALPWAWLFGEGQGYPSLSQISGSQIVLKDGIRSLHTADLTSWWTFLLMGTITYGLLPRVLLALLSTRLTAQSLQRLDFSDAASQRLLRRLTPTQDAFTLNTEAPTTAYASKARPQPTQAPNANKLTAAVAWIAPSLWADQDIMSRISQQIDTRNINKLDNILVADPQALSKSLPDPSSRLAFVLESWLPPLEETKQLLREARSQVDPKTSIDVYLHSGDEEIRSSDLDVWCNAIQQLGDPYLNVGPISS